MILRILTFVFALCAMAEHTALVERVLRDHLRRAHAMLPEILRLTETVEDTVRCLHREGHALRRQLERGLSFGAPCALETELAELIVEHPPVSDSFDVILAIV